MPSIYCNNCGEEINVKIDYGDNPIDDMIDKLKLMGYVIFKKKVVKNA